ncbi:MAG: chlorophyll synthesis pathway protein BchC, partial [Myxococcota bacterium]
DGYSVVRPEDDKRSDYTSIYDVSGDAGLLDTLIMKLAKGGEITLAGFYSQPVSFNFPGAFMKEARLRVAAEWLPSDMVAINEIVANGKLSLEGLITHRHEVGEATPSTPSSAYATAFSDPECLKMLLDWRQCS